MRKSDVAVLAAKKSAAVDRNEVPVPLVCLALSLALLALAGRVFSVW